MLKKNDHLPSSFTARAARRLLLAALLLLATGCTLFREVPVTRETALEKLSPLAYPAFTDDLDYQDISDVVSLSIAYLEKVPQEREFQFGADRYRADHLLRSFTVFNDFIAANPSAAELKKFINAHYLVYQSVGADDTGDVLFTGYYEPSLLGSLTPSDEFKYPLYSLPDDLIVIDLSLFSPKYKNEKITGRYTGQTVLPYYDRSEIDRQAALEGKVKPLAWVKDPIDLFFLHIQGSGKIFLEDGSSVNVHYHGANGRPYKSIGRLLIDSGKIEKAKMSMQSIRSYLKAHPDEVAKILDYNPSYVFFRLEEDGPIGCLGVKLTPARSIALDRRLFPLPALAFIQTEKPVVDDGGNILEWINFKRFVVSQDTGGAIRGPGRADIFWGNGPYAEAAAGHLQHPGQLYFLVLKPGR